MAGVLAGLGVVAVVALILWGIYDERRIAVELASRSEQEYNVAGFDKADVVASHATWGITPWRMRQIRRRLDDAAEKIARFEQGEDRR